MLQTFKAMRDHLRGKGFVFSENTIRNWQYTYGYKPKKAGRQVWDTVEDFERFFFGVICKA